jgi:hypothetical protein
VLWTSPTLPSLLRNPLVNQHWPTMQIGVAIRFWYKYFYNSKKVKWLITSTLMKWLYIKFWADLEVIWLSLKQFSLPNLAVTIAGAPLCLYSTGTGHNNLVSWKPSVSWTDNGGRTQQYPGGHVLPPGFWKIVFFGNVFGTCPLLEISFASPELSDYFYWEKNI